MKQMFLEANRKREGFFLETVRDHWGVKLYGGEVNPSLNIRVSIAPALLGHTIVKQTNNKLDHSVYRVLICPTAKDFWSRLSFSV